MVATVSADELKHNNIKYWDDLLNHKFILEMAADSLPIEKFAFYLRQDHIFLKEFCAFLLTAKQKSSDQKLRIWFESLYHSTIDSEMQMQRELLLLLGISNIDNNATTAIAMAPATLNYILFLRQVSSSTKNIEVIVSAMAPCPWSYLEIAQKLSKSDIKTDVYCKWIQFYSSKESQQQIDELKNILSRLYNQANESTKMHMKQHFRAACKYEYDFWEMSYNNVETKH
ncbi:MAG: thiaminase II [Nitrososphaeraceae archaeon]|nr:thiaminase II [Nitrososphaeraceae archaeon]